MRCPSRYSGYEAEIKTLASKVLLRGKVDLQLNVDRGAGESTSTIDIGLAKSYFKQVSNLAEELNLKTEGMLQTVLRMPEVVRTKKEKLMKRSGKKFTLSSAKPSQTRSISEPMKARICVKIY